MFHERMALSEQQTELVESIASGVESVTVDGLTTKEASVDSKIKAFQFLSQLDAQQQKKRPFKIQTLRSPGGVYGS